MDDQHKPEPGNGTNGQITPNGLGSASFFDQKKDDDEVFVKPPSAPESGVKNFFENAASHGAEGEIIASPHEVKSEQPKEPNAVAEVSVIDEEKDAPLASSTENFLEKFRDTLAESGIDMSKLRSYLVGCVIFLVLVFALFFGGMKGYRFLRQKFSDIPEASQAPSETGVLPAENSSEIFPESLESAVLLGEELGAFRNFPNPPLAIAYELGKEAQRFQKRFVQQIDFLNEMRSTVKTDVFRLLDQSRNREKALSDYMETLIREENAGREISAEIDGLIRLMETRFNNAVEAKTLYETRFFETLKNLQGKESDEMLQGFTDMAEQAAAAKGQFHALSKLKAHYETVLRWISLRRTTIELNKEALIKGVKVVGVEGSDLELILTQESLSSEVER